MTKSGSPMSDSTLKLYHHQGFIIQKVTGYRNYVKYFKTIRGSLSVEYSDYRIDTTQEKKSPLHNMNEFAC